ncbi:tape measure protein [Weissella coleopterorum]|uniref:Tape measure protein n=1 Tax=Weissella coleopterorum TaxID=2714949 RepID=A0A6G8AY97_9LACO|nr:tape measure protein [Weissella coleopterorum]QIL49853.1 tape measure protein [Weissella coleopterorum]
MAKEKIAGLMATGIGLNANGAVESLGKLKSAVKDSTNEWKQMESQMKQSGDVVGAAKAKYEGLNKSVAEQRDVLAKAKAEQAEINRSTNDGEKAYQKYATEITSAERKLTSLISQSEKAKQSYQYQESGLAKLDEELKRSNDLTDAKVKKLEAEGRTEEANKAKLAGLTEQQSIYTKKLEIQKTELDKIGESGEKNSKTYKQQELRVEQMGAKLAQTTGKIKNFNHTEVKPETTGLTKAKTQLEHFDGLISKSNNHFKSFLMGNVVATGITSALSDIKSKFTGALKAGVEYNKEIQSLTISMDNFTNGNTKLKKELVENVQKIHEESGYAIDTVSLLTKKTYGLTGSADGAKDLSMAFVNLGRATGQSDDSMKGIIKRFSQMNASGEITTGSLTKMEKSLPGFNKALSDSMGKSRDEIKKLASDGKLSMEDMSKAIETMSNAKPKGLENYYKTLDGFSGHLEERYKSLSGKITGGFFQSNNDFLAKMSKSLDGKDVDKAFNHVGDSANKAVNTVSEAFSSTFKSGKNPVAGFADESAKQIEKLGNFVADHSKDIKNFFQMTKDIGGAGFKLIGDTLKVALPLLEKVGDFASKHPKDIKLMAEMYLGLNLALKGTFGAMNTVDKFSKLVFKPKVDGSDAKRELTWLGQKAKDAGGLMKKGLNATARVATKAATKSFELLKKGAKASGKAMGKALSVTAKVATKAAKLALKGLLVAAKTTGKGMKLAFNFLKANPLGILIIAITAVIAGFVALYKHSKKFRKFIDGIVKAVKNFAKAFTKGFSGAWSSVTKGLGKFTKSFSKTWNKFGDNTHKAWDKTTGKLKNSTSKYFDVEKKGVKLFADFFTGKWDNLGKDLRKIWDALWDFLESIFGKKIRNIKTGIEDFGKRIAEIFNDIKKKVSDTWQGLWDGMKDIVKNGINAVIDIVNSGIGGINSVIHTFGGKKDAIGKISHIKKFAKGTKGAPKGLAMVNDAPGEHFQEAIVDNSGQTHVLEGRNRLVNFSGGETVIPAHAIPKFAEGTDNWLGSIGNWFKDKWEGLTEIIKHPLDSLKKVMGKAVSGMIGNQNELVKNLAPALGNGLVGGIVDPIKKMFENLKKKHEDEDGGGGRGAPSGAGVQRWKQQVIDALKANGLSTSDDMVNKVLRQIATESGGNEKAVQGDIGDVNNASGDLAKGLMQTISATFNAYKFPGHGNIFNGYDNLLAALKYAKNRYGSNLSFLGNGHGYENGGIVSRHGLYEVAERNMPEMIIPLSADKRSKAVPLLQEANKRINGSQNAVSSTTDLSSIENGMDQMITLMSMLLGVSKEQLTALSNRKSVSMNDLYSKMATDSNLRNSTTI